MAPNREAVVFLLSLPGVCGGMAQGRVRIKEEAHWSASLVSRSSLWRNDSFSASEREMVGYQMELLAAPRKWNPALHGPCLAGNFLPGKTAKWLVTAVA